MPPRTVRRSGRARACPSGARRPRALPRARRDTAPRAGPRRLPASRLRAARRVLEPLRPALAAAVHGVEIRLLQLDRHRTGRADDVVVDLADRRHLGRGADHEHLVCEVEIGSDERLLDDAVAEILRDLDDRVARYPDEDRRRKIRRVDDAVAHDEDALAGAVRDVAVGGEEDRLLVAGAHRLADGEHRVDVDAGRLRDVRDDVRADALPARHLDTDAFAHALLAEVRAPRPRHDRDVDGVALRGDAELSVAEERDGTEVRLGKPVRTDELPARLLQLGDGVRELHVQEPGRLLETLHVLGEPEDRRSALGVIGANAFEHSRAVVQAVGPDVNG